MTDVFFRCAAAAVICIVLILCLRGRNAETALVISLVCCCMIAISAGRALADVVEFLQKLEAIGNLDRGLLRILLKIVGVGFVGELAVTICNDSGNAAIGKTLQILATSMILYLTLPLFTQVMELIERIMGNL